MLVEYQNGQVFDGTKFVKRNFAVQDGRFVEPTATPDQVVDLAGKFVTPGLMNAHTHVTMSADPTYWQHRPRTAVTETVLALDNLKAALSVGVTYVRDVGSTHDVDLDLMKLDRDDLPGLVGSGQALSMTGGHGSGKGQEPKNSGTLEVDGEAAARRGAREVLRKGAKNVKLMATGGVSTPGETPFDEQLSEAEMRAAVVEAHHKGYTAAAHAQGTAGIKNAVRAGVDSVEHAIYLDEEAVALMKQHHTTVVPTLVAPRAIYENPAALPAFMVEKAKLVAKAHLASTKQAVAAGVPVVMGTDAGTPFNTFDHWVLVELEMYRQAGMTPAQVLNSATSQAAKLLHLTDVTGQVKEGLDADFVVLAEDPRQDFFAYERQTAVYRRGKKLVDRLTGGDGNATVAN